MKKMIIIVSALMFWSVSSYAIDKATISINDGSSSKTGGGRREEALNVKITKGVRGDAIPIDDKIMALEQKLIFYKLLKEYNIDINQKVDGNYTNLQLRGVLETLLPGIKIKFDGVDEERAIASMIVTNARLELVLDSLDDAAGVYFQFSKKGITVTGMPRNP